jgi:hypothetical protein
MFLAVAPRASAGAVSSCEMPIVFEGAEVNVVVLPYFQSGSSPRELNGLGSQLALLVKLETLYGALAYDRWGVILLTGSKQACDPDRIARELLARIHPSGRLLVVWGKLYQQDEDVYAQTFARFYRKRLPSEKAPPPDVGVQVGGKTFQGRITDQQFAFPPEQLSIKVMDAIAANFAKVAYIYDQPNLNAPKHHLPLEEFRKCDKCPDALAFTVEDQADDWIHVQPRQGRDGYLLAHVERGMSLNEQMPEVGFVKGLMGFLRYVESLSETQTPRMSAGIQVALQSLMEYAKRGQADEEPETKALALQLSGILQFSLKRDPSLEQFDKAYELVPYNADARNLAAMFRLYRDYSSSGKNIRARDTANDFIAAVALQPRNPLVLGNLESFYELLKSQTTQDKISPGTAIAADEIEAQLGKLRAIIQRLGENPAVVRLREPGPPRPLPATYRRYSCCHAIGPESSDLRWCARRRRKTLSE